MKRLKLRNAKRKPADPFKGGQVVFGFISSLLVLAIAFSFAFEPALRMVRIWMGQDGIQRYKLDFQADGVPAEWGYACWTGPFTENLGQFGFPGEGPVNETRTQPPAINHNIGGGVLNINGTNFSSGIGAHAPSKVAFSPQGMCKRFSCLAGLDVSAKESRGVIYTVTADGREIFKSPKLKGDADPYPIDLSISDVKELVLCADTVEFEDVGSDVDWVNLKFER